MVLPSDGIVLPARIQPAHLRPLAYRVLSKKYGLSIKSDGLTALASIIGSRFGTNWKKNPETLKFLDEFAQVWKQQDRGLFVNKDGCDKVLNEIEERVCFDESNASRVRDSNMVTDQGEEGSISPTDTDIDMGLMPIPSMKNDLNWTEYFKVVNASEQFYFPYDGTKRHYTSPHEPMNLVTDLKRKIGSYTTRYFITRDRTLRNENFQNSNDNLNPLSSMIALQNDLIKNDLDTSTPSTYMAITQIKNLLGRDGQNFLILGFLNYNAKGNLQMEDPSGKIEIDITQANPTEGLYYYPGCIILAEGIYFSVGHKFHITSLTHPPAERREVTQEAVGNIDFLNTCNNDGKGPISRITNDLKIRLLSLERDLNEQQLNNFILLGGEMFLGEQNTLDALKKVFRQVENEILESGIAPLGIVFFGSFTSSPIFPSYSETSMTSSRLYEMSFEYLANLLSQFENIIKHCQLIFVPGPEDPWGGTMALGNEIGLPQEPIPSEFVKKMKRFGANIKWASNPSRIVFLSQEIVLIRDDMNRKFKSYSIEFPLVEEAKANKLDEVETQLNNVNLSDNDYNSSDNEELEDGTVLRHDVLPTVPEVPFTIMETRKYVKTLLDQGHLAPFSSTPIHYNRDHTLSMCPVPSVLIICDPTVSRFDLTYNGCKTINPGKFILNKTARYLKFNPTTRTVSQEEVTF